LFTSNRDGNQEVYVMNVGGSQPTNLTNNPAEDQAGAWSANGAWVAFTTNRDGNKEIYTMTNTGANPYNLTMNPAQDEFPAWH
jgi:Tol biopolymer transport system component